MEQIGIDAAKAITGVRDSNTSAATEARRLGSADFLKAFEAGLERNRVSNNGLIPNDFSLTDSSMASLVNCGLKLEVDDMVGAEFVKRFRQRERERERAKGEGFLDQERAFAHSPF
ncbi:hypothetical protein [Pseudomonas asiatica]|uniref:hypothetical protein n=1 Tax=Pseudomonas asiatica TaxID=2219225 RepID=UPI0025A4A266|nr:hypothetical protein [Pseudomonas asiatica]WJN48613.1 hypothetical protein QUR91_18415 [Pseudomonas asiatica]